MVTRNKNGQFIKGIGGNPNTRFKVGNKQNLGKHWKIKDTSNMKGRIRGRMRGDKNPTKRPEVRKKLSEKRRLRRGEKSPNWKGGISYTDEKVRKSTQFHLWRKACLERDNFTCQKTGISGGLLHIHHINNFAEFHELRFAIDNGITLSEKAHIEFHKKYGFKHNTREQLEEFLSQVN